MAHRGEPVWWDDLECRVRRTARERAVAVDGVQPVYVVAVLAVTRSAVTPVDGATAVNPNTQRPRPGIRELGQRRQQRPHVPSLNSGRVELLDHARTIAQLCALERRTARGGRDSVDHPPGGHDDVINAVAGALVTAVRPATWQMLELEDVDADDVDRRHPYDVQLARVLPDAHKEPEDLTCGECVHRRLENGQPRCGLRLFWIEDRDVACDAFDLRASA